MSPRTPPTPARLLLLAAILALLLPLRATAAAPPNLLVILSDDQGYLDAGFQGSREIPTPNLDRLAQSGVRCTSGYASHPFCSPTRAGLLTGRYQARFGHENNPVYDPLDEKEGLPLTERLLPQFMQDAGYRTGWIGKWHLGASPVHVPWRRGFDEAFGFIGGGHRYLGWKTNGNQYTLALTRNGLNVEVTNHLTLALGDEAGAFIRRNQAKPWFLYLAFNAPHTPHEPTPEREARFSHIQNAQRRRCAAQVSLLDDAIGTVLSALADSGQDQRTLVFFIGDNGGAVGSGANNGPLRAQKGTLHEGGVRVPYLVRWTGRLPAGATYNAPVSSLDVFATALALAGVPLPKDRPYDSVNLVPHLAGETKAPPHERLFWRSGKNGHAVREGNWKLVRPKGQPAQLYDLAADLGETKDLATAQPEIARRLTAVLDAWDGELVPPAFPGSSVKNEDWGPGGANQRNKPAPKPKAPARKPAQP